MNKTSNVRRITLCAMCVALCYVLPIAFHAVGLGSILSPMHIPVLLCGLICGGGYGLVCGVVGPVLSSLLSGMPPLLMLVRMIPELAAYGLVSGLLMGKLRTGKLMADTYIALACAMIVGRIAGGVATAVFFAATSGVYSIALWVTSYFVEALPGIAAHLVLIPLLVFTLEKAKAISPRYPKTKAEVE